MMQQMVACATPCTILPPADPQTRADTRTQRMTECSQLGPDKSQLGPGKLPRQRRRLTGQVSVPSSFILLTILSIRQFQGVEALARCLLEGVTVADCAKTSFLTSLATIVVRTDPARRNGAENDPMYYTSHHFPASEFAHTSEPAHERVQPNFFALSFSHKTTRAEKLRSCAFCSYLVWCTALCPCSSMPQDNDGHQFGLQTPRKCGSPAED